MSATSVEMIANSEQFPCHRCQKFRKNDRFYFAWCDEDKEEFPHAPEQCSRYIKKNNKIS